MPEPIETTPTGLPVSAFEREIDRLRSELETVRADRDRIRAERAHARTCAANLAAELARVRGERDRMVGWAVAVETLRGEGPAWAITGILSALVGGSAPTGDPAAALAEHDRRSAAEGER